MNSNQIQVGGPNDCPPVTTTTTPNSSEHDFSSPIERGWECPRCHHINAPWVRQCDCSAEWKITCDAIIPKNDWWESYVKATQADCVGGSDYFNPNGAFWSNISEFISNIKEIY